MRIAVAVATTGRAEVLVRTVPTMLAQTRAPDRCIVVAVKPADVEGLDAVDPKIETAFAPRPGLTIQRNAALDALAGDCDVVVFFDDDFVPSNDFLARTEKLFAAHADIVALTGALAADGINEAGLEFEEAVRIARDADARLQPLDAYPPPFEITHVYGCNMAARMDAALKVRFDERLPLYAWQEDRDFSARMRAFGRIARTPALTGVHMGVKRGRQSGVKLGYSQVANPIYMLRKGTMRPVETLDLVGRNVLANIARSLKPEPWVDRAGRVRGNLMALADALRGRITPERILDLAAR